MGLCKCPKRKVTNQFCFEHRVNVCEHCMVSKHPKCVVQSYLQWLKDSDYDPKCTFCHHDLTDDTCVRLVCYHVFHWVCLDKYARSLPASTAPAGYTCPICQDHLFPPDNLVGPVADQLRNVLRDVNWARAGLGLPLLEDAVEKIPVPSGPRPNPEGHLGTTPAPSPAKTSSNIGGDGIVHFDTPTSRAKDHHQTGAASSHNMDIPMNKADPDRDENKYKRRSGLELLLRWGKNAMMQGVATTTGSGSRRRPANKLIRHLKTIIVIVLVLMAIAAIFSQLSRSSDFDDPMLEPLNNPNIRVANERNRL